MKMPWPSLKQHARTILMATMVLVLCLPTFGIIPIAHADTLAGSGPGGTDGSSTLSQEEVSRMTADIQYELQHNNPPFTQASADEKTGAIQKGAAGQLDANALRALRDWDIAVQNEIKADQAAGSASSSAATAANAAAAAAAAAGHCDSGIGGIGCWIQHLPNLILAGVGYFILSLCGFILWICGVLFNWTVLRTVFQFATYFGNSAGMLIAWGVLRDVGNILLLFGFIFLGVATILNVNSHGHSASSNIPRLIIFALLLNFSLLAAEAVIDTSNAFASVLSTQAGVVCNQTSTDQSGGSDNCANQGISGKALALVGLASVWQVPTQLGDAANASIPTIITTYMGGAIFLIILAFVLLAAAIMLITRAAILCFLIVTSPIGFAGMAIPPLEGLAKKWWQMLLSQAFFAPVLILCILVSFKIADSLSNGASLIGALQGGSADSMQVVLVFAVIIAFLLASLMAAKQMGAAGAAFATDFSRKAVSFAPALAGRAVVGGGSALVQRHYEAKMGDLRQDKGWRGTVARSFVGNFADDAITGTLEKNKNNNFGGVIRSYSDDKKHREERASHLAHEAHKAHDTARLKEALKNGTDADVQSASQQMSNDDLKNYLKRETEGIEKLARNLSPEKFEALMNDKDVTSDVKTKFVDNRFRDLKSAIGAGYKDGKDEVRKWSNEDLAMLAKYDPNAFNELANIVDDPTKDGGTGSMMMSSDQYDALKKNKALTKGQKDNLNDHSKVGQIMSIFKDKDLDSGVRTTALKNLAKGMKKAVGDIPDDDVLTDVAVIDSYDTSSLSAIMSKKDELDQAHKDAIMDHIQKKGPGDPQYDQVAFYLDKNNTAAAWWGRKLEIKDKKKKP